MKVKPPAHGRSEQCENPSPFLKDFAPLGLALEEQGRETREIVLLGVLRPGSEFAQRIEAEGAENIARQSGDAAAGVEIEQHAPQGANGKVISASAIAKEVAPPAGAVFTPSLSACQRGARSRDHSDSIAISKGGGEARLAIASHPDGRLRPNRQGDLEETAAVLLGSATGEEYANMGNMAGQAGKKPLQSVRFQKLHATGADAALVNGIQGLRRHPAERPIGLCRSAVDPQDKLLRHAAHAYILPKMAKGTWFFSVFLGFLFGVWVVTLWIFSSLPGQDIHLPPFPESDKVAHFGYFFTGGLLLAGMLRSTLGWRGRKLFFTVLCAIALIGALDEIHQLYTRNRSGGDPADWATDCAGGALGALVIGWIYVRGRERRIQVPGGVVAQGD